METGTGKQTQKDGSVSQRTSFKYMYNHHLSSQEYMMRSLENAHLVIYFKYRQLAYWSDGHVIKSPSKQEFI